MALSKERVMNNSQSSLMAAIKGLKAITAEAQTVNSGQ
jgi:hypothetical protein